MRINEYGTVEMNAGEVQKINKWLREDESRMEQLWIDAVKQYIRENEDDE